MCYKKKKWLWVYQVIQMFVNLDTFIPSKVLVFLADDSIFCFFFLKQGSETYLTLENNFLEMPTDITGFWNPCYSRNKKC